MNVIIGSRFDEIQRYQTKACHPGHLKTNLVAAESTVTVTIVHSSTYDCTFAENAIAIRNNLRTGIACSMLILRLSKHLLFSPGSIVLVEGNIELYSLFSESCIEEVSEAA